MLLDVVSVQPLQNYRILITFENGEKKIFDVTPILEREMWQELRDTKLFSTVEVHEGTVQWENGQDICPDWLYQDGVSVGSQSQKG